MSPKLSRLLLIATVAAGFGVLPMQGASAAAQRGVDVDNMPIGFSNGVPGVSGDCQSNDPNKIPVTNLHAHDTVIWHIKNGTHNITPAQDVQSAYGHAANWPKGVGPSGDKNPGDDYQVTFTNPGLYFYFSSTNNEGADTGGRLSGMCGVINVDVDTTPTTTTTTPPATTPDTQPPATTPTTSAPSGPAPTTPTAPPSTHAPTTAPPAPTTTTAVKGDKKPKDSSTTTTTTAPPAINIPPEAIIPDIGGSTGSAAQNGVVQPSSTPSGDAVAVIKRKHSDNAKKMLIVTGIGIGALGIGAGAYKWANRSSKYFPA